MAKKEFTYKGYTIKELRAMSMDELVKILPSRIRRSLLRGFNERSKKLMIDIKKNRKAMDDGGKPKAIKTHCRNFPILPEMVDMSFSVYNGKEFVAFEVKPDMIGQYLGEFALTRKPVKHSAPGIGATRSSLFVPIK